MNNENNQLVPAQQFEQLKMELAAVKAKDFAKLGDGSIFWIEPDNGEKKRGFKARVDFTSPDQFCLIQGKPMICAQGYDKANQYAGVEIVRPKTVTIEGGKEVGNPYFEKDKNGALVSIFIRGIGIGYNPTGALAIVDQTVFVNLNTLLVQEVQAKLKYDPTIATLGIEGEKPTSFVAHITKWNNATRKREVVKKETVEVIGAWHYLPVHSNMGYWIDLSHPDIQAAFDGFVQKQRFLERTATTVLKRLILSTHPAIATKTPIVTDDKERGGKAHIYVYGFRAEDGDAKKKREDLEALAAKLAAGEASADMEVIKTEAKDITEDAEILDSAAVADPSEIPVSEPPAGFEDEKEFENNFPTYSERVMEEAIGGNPTKGAIVNQYPKERLAELFKNPSLQPVCMKVAKEIGTTPMKLRSASDEAINDFIGKVETYVD